MITIEDFSKVVIRIGTVLEAEKVPDADKLIRLVFDFGALEENETLEITLIPELVEKYPNRHVRQVMSAIAPFYADPTVLVGKQIAVVTNLEPRKFRGYESQGMIMAADADDAEVGIVLMSPERRVGPGAKIH